MRTAWALGALLAVLPQTSADAAPGDVGIVRDVRPTTLERGDTLVVECVGIRPIGAAVTVLVKGRWNAETTLRGLVLEGRVAGGDRVLVDADDVLERRIGKSLRITGAAVEVEQFIAGERQTSRRWKTRPGEEVTLQLFPQTFRRAAAAPAPFLTAALVLVLALAIHLLVAPVTGLVVVWERKIAGRMQSRFGPNRVGPRGWLQWLADAIKLITKEDLVPREADRSLFRLAPYLVWMSVFATLVVLPLSQTAIVADINVGLLYLVSVTSFTVVGIIGGGWASNSKWSLLGGMRSAAQIVSYELPAALGLLQVALLAGTLSPQEIVRAQGGLPHQWFLFANPFAFGCFFIYFISALAEGNRAPFDLPEAESELVSGYNTEYSGFRFSIFSLAEWTNLYVLGAVASVAFLGGWNLPFVTPAQIAASPALGVLSMLVMVAKVVVLVFVIIWIRWTLPRFRVDQMMTLCWKYLVPLAFAAFLGTAAWLWVIRAVPALDTAMRCAMFLGPGLGVLLFFLSRVIHNFRSTNLLHLGTRQLTLPFLERHIDKRPPT